MQNIATYILLAVFLSLKFVFDQKLKSYIQTNCPFPQTRDWEARPECHQARDLHVGEDAPHRPPGHLREDPGSQEEEVVPDVQGGPARKVSGAVH